MVKKIQKIMKNQKGLTLVELLAVIVILGIIAAIAVPSIGGIIDNSKKDAHISNAQQMLAAAKVIVASNDSLGDGDNIFTLTEMVNDNYMEEIPKDPEGTKYDGTKSFVTYNKGTTGDGKYTVTLEGAKLYLDDVTGATLSSDGRDALTN